MKKIILIILIIIPLLMIKIPKYRELNHLKIISSVGIDCINNKVYLKEIIPIKDDNGIEYKYKLYEFNDLGKVIKSKKYYIKKTTKVITNCQSNKIPNYFKNITYKKKIKKELSKKT